MVMDGYRGAHRFQLLDSFSRSILACLEGLQELLVEAIELPVEGTKTPLSLI